MHDAITYSTSMSACEKGTHPERAFQFSEVMRQQGVTPNAVTYNASISVREQGKPPQ